MQQQDQAHDSYKVTIHGFVSVKMSLKIVKTTGKYVIYYRTIDVGENISLYTKVKDYKM